MSPVTKQFLYNSFDINGTDAVKPVQVATVSAKEFQSVYSIFPAAITTVHCPVIFCCSPISE